MNATATQPTDLTDQAGHARGLTVAGAAKRYRVSPDKVRAWINRGELLAVNTAAALSGKPRYVITPEALAAFEQLRAAGPPAPRPTRPRKRSGKRDRYA